MAFGIEFARTMPDHLTRFQVGLNVSNYASRGTKLHHPKTALTDYSVGVDVQGNFSTTFGANVVAWFVGVFDELP